MMRYTAVFPTDVHRTAATAVFEQYRRDDRVEAILVVNSCARGQATPASDLDMLVLVTPSTPAAERRNLEAAWLQLRDELPALTALRRLSQFSTIHLDFADGQFIPETWDDGGGPDDFELGIGNGVAYSALLWERADAYQALRTRWLPFYGEELRGERLAMVAAACRYDLAFIPFYVERGLHFQAFDRLYKALREFLQGIFIARRTYPLAYNKWIRMQIVDWLGLPDIYIELTQILAISQLESEQVAARADQLTRLVDRWLVP